MSTQPQFPVERNEAALIARVTAGEKALFHELIRPYERSVYLAAYSILHNPADAEEVAQETLLKALTNLHQLRADDKFKGWLLQIAFNEARMRIRKNHKNLYESLQGEGEGNDEAKFVPREFADWRDIPSDALEKKEIRQAVARALITLSEKYRQVFLLRDVQHLSVEETARVLGISKPAVKTQLLRARLQMRELLAPVFRQRWSDRLPFWKGKKPW